MHFLSHHPRVMSDYDALVAVAIAGLATLVITCCIAVCRRRIRANQRLQEQQRLVNPGTMYAAFQTPPDAPGWQSSPDEWHTATSRPLRPETPPPAYEDCSDSKKLTF